MRLESGRQATAGNTLLDAFRRAVKDCLQPRVVGLSILPAFLMTVLLLSLGYFYWGGALASVRGRLEGVSPLNTLALWLEGMGLGSLHGVLAPFLLLFLVISVVVVATLLLVSVFMTPSMVNQVARERFAMLELKNGGSLLAGVMRSIGLTALAAAALLVSIPLWLVPPLILILPPLIWGWLTYRVMPYDVLAGHASREERLQIVKAHRLPLLAIGIASGYLGAAPSLVWASGVLFVALAPVMIPIAIWIYTLAFTFSSLWFAHYCLAALEQLRKKNSGFPQATPEVGAINKVTQTALPGNALQAERDSTLPGRPPDSLP